MTDTIELEPGVYEINKDKTILTGRFRLKAAWTDKINLDVVEELESDCE